MRFELDVYPVDGPFVLGELHCLATMFIVGKCEV